MTPTPDDILACGTAFELFGEAVHDRRSLKRAYAALIKVYDPDGHPEVFAHVRARYEAARAGETGAPAEGPALRLVPDTTDSEPSECAEEQSPADRLCVAMEAGHADDALEVLAAHDLEVRIERPDVWFASVASLADARTFELSTELLRSWLDAVDSAPDIIPAAMLERIELLTLTGLGYQTAREDPHIEGPLLDLLALWGRDPVTVAEAFMALGEALPDDGQAWAAHQALKRRYPELWFPYTLMAHQVTREVDSFNEEVAFALHSPRADAWKQAWAERRGIGAVGLSLVAVSAAGLVAVSLAGAPPLLLSGCGVLFGLGLWGVWHHARAFQSRPYAQARKELLSLAHTDVRFPHEALDLALPAPNDPMGAPLHALETWQRDPTTFLRVLTPAHIDRVRARLDEASAPQESP